MFQATQLKSQTKDDCYRELELQLMGLLEGERNWVANAANFSALLYLTLPDLNWAGFYVLRPTAAGSELVLGPFQGKPACVRIPVAPVARGVCGTAARECRTIVVPNVHEFPGHIACDGASNSEVVVPLIKGGALWGVLDLDSPRSARFDHEDAAGLEKLVEIFVAMTDLGDALAKAAAPQA
jgi:L-methionine (R)-S-oxide reductase